ncbi:restriction endonuclease subunit S [Faecalicatena acetigenes]|uniref:Restriction endonuclease subunit S n=1 Tax=Faecalicatena acetigenes TaxID=2981790 RepID=A0ABT2TB99_9FIRM|nr:MULTISPECIES: restriction endonuclease subunit S [Lachnospiraceae]MCU6747555.1 restriction endonuclease subunit S [Faecalicatena acetigenes]SCH95025.1 EcoKI restriction-modification system protein HsdS [uncultured Clostridium sp.]
MAKLIEITGKALSGEWGTDDETGEGIPVLRTTNFTNEGVVDYNNVVTRIITKKNIEEKFLRKGDIIIEKSGGSDKQPVGRVIYFDGPENVYLFNNFTGLLRIKEKKVWNPKYVFYSLYANYRRGGTRPFENKTTGLHNLKTDDYVARYEIKEVNYDYQKEVCEQLDIISDVIKLRQKELQKLDNLIRARFVELFGDPVANPMHWPVKRLKELAIQINSGNTPKGGSENYVEKGITFFRSQNVWKDRLEMDDIAYIDEKTHESMKRSSLKHGDILMTKTGRINTENSSLGRAALYEGEDDMANVNGHVYFIRLKEGVNNKFVLRVLVSPEYRDLIRSVCVGGIDKRQLNKEHIEEFPIIYPPSEMIDNYIEFVEQVNKSKVAIQAALDKTQLLFDSLMQKYFG